MEMSVSDYNDERILHQWLQTRWNESPAPLPSELHHPLQAIERISIDYIRKDGTLSCWFSVYELESLARLQKGQNDLRSITNSLL